MTFEKGVLDRAPKEFGWLRGEGESWVKRVLQILNPYHTRRLWLVSCFGTRNTRQIYFWSVFDALEYALAQGDPFVDLFFAPTFRGIRIRDAS